MKKKSYVLACAALLATSALQAQRIDINLINYRDIDTAPGYTPWAFGRVASATETFTGSEGQDVTITIAPVPGLLGNGVFTNWWKTGVRNYGYTLIGDMAAVTVIDDEGNYNTITEGSSGIQLTISGLTAGQHTLMAYHCNTDGGITLLPTLDVVVDGQTLATGVAQRAQTMKPSDTPFSYVTFTAEEGRDVVVQYISKPEAGVSYSRTDVALNALVFDEANPITTAHDPYPVNQDLHADGNVGDDDPTHDGHILLQWYAAQTAVRHHLMLGVASGEEQEIAVLTDTCYNLTQVAVEALTGQHWTANTCYWRVDEEDADGHIYPGEEWTFRPRRLAFPGAEGYGRFAQGGRGGVVYHVTNLSNDLTPGSFIYGVTQLTGPRTIVFDVAGTIDMDFGAVFVAPYVTIAAQTAPGKGICLKHSNLNIGSDNICRFLRARRGYGDTGNAMGATGADHTIIDHTSAIWGTDETFSGRGAKNFTFQYSMIAEALGIADHKNYAAGMNHGFAATIDGKIGSYHHNLLADCNGRNWSMGGGMDGNNTAIGQMDIFNNVVYNWNGRTTDGGCHEVNFVANYYKMGQDTRRTELFIQQYENVGSPESKWQAYISGNIRENKNGTLTTDRLGTTYTYTLSNGAEDPNKRAVNPYNTFVDQPFFPSYAEIHTAQDAFKIVTSNSGANMPCIDEQHQRMITETVKGTWTYVGSRSGIHGEIDHEDDAGGFEEFPEETRPADYDADGDGIPAWFEALVGTDDHVANHNADADGDGWTDLEFYLDFVAHPYFQVAAGSSVTVDLGSYFQGFTQSPRFTAEGAYALTGMVPSRASLASDVQASVEGQSLTLSAVADHQGQSLYVVPVSVVDSDGSTYERTLHVAVVGDAVGIETVGAEAKPVQSRTFDLMGRPVGSQRGLGVRDGKVVAL